MSDAVLVLMKFLGSGAFATILIFVYNKIRLQAKKSDEQETNIDQLQKDRDEMKLFFEKITGKWEDRFDIATQRIGEISGKQKDQAKDISLLQENDREIKLDVKEILKAVHSIQVSMAAMAKNDK